MVYDKLIVHHSISAATISSSLINDVMFKITDLLVFAKFYFKHTMAPECFLNREKRGGTKNIKYKFRFAPKFAKYLHQPVISIGVESCTFSSHLTRTGVWGRSPQPSEVRWYGSGSPNAWRFGEIYYQNNPFLGMF